MIQQICHTCKKYFESCTTILGSDNYHHCVGCSEYFKNINQLSHMTFTVTNHDGSEPDFKKIAYEENWWAWYSMVDKCMFALMQDGSLIVVNRGNSISRCPPGRFIIHTGKINVNINEIIKQKIWEILIELGVSSSLKESFFYLWPCDEFRFEGKLGFGGKIYFDIPPYILCYPEDETSERKTLIATANRKLIDLYKK